MTRRKVGATEFNLKQSIEIWLFIVCFGSSDFISRLVRIPMTRHKVGATEYNLKQSIEIWLFIV
jgi:hypothetical protein